MSGNEQIKMQKTVLNQLVNDTRLNIILKLVSRHSKATHDLPLREFYIKSNQDRQS